MDKVVICQQLLAIAKSLALLRDETVESTLLEVVTAIAERRSIQPK